MKRIISSGLLFVCLTIFASAVVLAKTYPKPLSTPTPTPVPKVSYELPYPGILPDHPLYFLKAFRDRLLGFLIQDPVKKAEFNLLMADKRLNMGVFLADSGKPALSEITLSKGEKYFELAVSELPKASAQGKEVEAWLVDKFQKAAAKHEEVLTEFLEKMPEEQKRGIQESLNLVKTIKEEVSKL